MKYLFSDGEENPTTSTPGEDYSADDEVEDDEDDEDFEDSDSELDEDDDDSFE